MAVQTLLKLLAGPSCSTPDEHQRSVAEVSQQAGGLPEHPLHQSEGAGHDHPLLGKVLQPYALVDHPLDFMFEELSPLL